VTTTLTREQLAAWLSAVHCDQELSASDFKAAFAISQAADPQGFIRSAALVKLAGAEPIADTIGRLAARGHLEACGNKRKIDAFRILVPAATKTSRRRAKPAEVIPFPGVRRAAFIRKQAAHMASLSQAQGDAHLRQQLRIQAETMRRRGIDEEVIKCEVKAIESAVRAELWRCIFTPEKPA
jgi:hypothetical protein